MSTKKIVLVVNDGKDLGSSYYRPFESFGKFSGDVDILSDSDKIKDIVLVVFTGGSDVSPSYYGEERNQKSYCWPERDAFEKKVFDRSVELKLNIAGICRGSQFICALSGGKLVQHINGHGGNHPVKTDDGRIVIVSSTHHQMQLPPPQAVPIAWAEPKRSTCYEGAPGVNYEPDREHDVVWYPHTNALGMQYHPEFMPKDSDGFKYSVELTERFFKLEKVQ